MTSRAKICLNTICKNESKIIPRLLSSVKDWIDYWVIFDNGSTDDTQKIVEDFFKENNVPGKLVCHVYDKKYKALNNQKFSLPKKSETFKMKFNKELSYQKGDRLILFNTKDVFTYCRVENNVEKELELTAITDPKGEIKEYENWFIALVDENNSLVNTNEFTFSDARNRGLNAAIQEIKSIRKDNETWYILLLDCDMGLEVIDPEWRSSLTKPAHCVRQGNSTIEYDNVRLVNVNTRCNYVLGTHEYIDIEGTYDRAPLQTIRMMDKMDGANRVVKFERDAEILTWETIKNPNNIRALFYLAQTYDGSGRIKDSIEVYKHRISLGGWHEEVYISMLRIGRMYLNLDSKERGKPDYDNSYRALAIDWFLRAYKENIHRAEPIYDIAKYYRERSDGWASVGYYFAKWASSIPFPSHDKASLFIERDIYDCKANYELSICSYYAGKIEEGIIASNNLILNKSTYDYIRSSAMNNIKFYCKPLASEKNTKKILVRNKYDQKHQTMNPSILKTKDGKTLISVREVNYLFNIAENNYIFDGTIRTYTHIIEHNIFNSEEYLIDQPTEAHIKLYKNYVTGFEDVRLFEYNSEIYGICTARATNPTGDNEIVVFSLTKDYKLNKVLRMKGYEDDKCQKNWLPMEGKNGEFLLLYSCDPVVILKPDLNTGMCTVYQKKEQKYHMKDFRGSGQLVKYKDGWLWVVHEVIFSTVNGTPRRYYVHRFLWMDQNYEIKKISRHFYFREYTVEYCAGMTLDEKWIYLTYGFEDREPYITQISHEELSNLWLSL